MKKAIAILLAVMLVVSMAPAAFASTTTLTTTVPGATYEFSIPADTTIKYNALDTSIGYLEVTKSSGFAVGKNLQITIEYGPFTNVDGSSTIPYEICADTTTDLNDTETVDYHSTSYSKASGSKFSFKGLNSGSVERLARHHTATSTTSSNSYYGDLGVVITKADWGKALVGNHTSTITFTAEVVQD